MENNWLKLMNLLKEVLILKEIVYQLMNKKILNELVEQRSPGFIDLEKRFNPDNLIYKYKNERISPKGFRNCECLIELFKDLR